VSHAVYAIIAEMSLRQKLFERHCHQRFYQSGQRRKQYAYVSRARYCYGKYVCISVCFCQSLVTELLSCKCMSNFSHL